MRSTIFLSLIVPSAVILLCATAVTIPAVLADSSNPPARPAGLVPEPHVQQACRERFIAGAEARGVSPQLAWTALADMTADPRVLERDAKQPEFFATFDNYITKRVNQARVAKGRALLAQHRALLDQVAAQYGVPAHYLVALWGLETNYGGYTGTMNVVRALFTLACDVRRSQFFESQLYDALMIADEGAVPLAAMRGSWAGAMGQTQFMPESFVRYAIDGDGDGQRDLWNNMADVFHSSANYLANIGWKLGERWGREVLLPPDFDYAEARLGVKHTLASWAARGVKRADGGDLPMVAVEASLILPSGASGPAFLVYDNFRAIMRWNHSIFYALAVGHLADRIAGAGTLVGDLNPDAPALTRAQVAEMQLLLNRLGFDAGEADGVVGSRTRQALRAFQQAYNLPADGLPNAAMLAALRNAAA